jgi:hypothetical protein
VAKDLAIKLYYFAVAATTLAFFLLQFFATLMSSTETQKYHKEVIRVGCLLVLRKYVFFFILIGLFLWVNVASSMLLAAFVSSEFLRSLMTSLVSSLSFLFTFVAITWQYIPNVSSRFWAKFLLLALVLFSFYASLSLAFGEPILTAMGFVVTPVPASSPLSPSEYARLSFFTYGFSSMTNGLVSVAVAYLLQKYMVRGVSYLFKRTTKYEVFFEADVKERSSVFVVVLWLLLLPFPIQNVLSPTPVGVSALGTSLYLVSTLALFAMWGLGLSRLVGVSKNKIFRLYPAARDTLFWFLAIQWGSVFVYSAFAPPILYSATVKVSLLLVRALFAFAPPALITAYLYKHVLEPRSETQIIEHIAQKEKIETARITVRAER